MDSEIQKRIERKGIVISRVPDWSKEVFLARAKSEFCDDYGMLLAAMVKECGEYAVLKEKFFSSDIDLRLLLGDNKVEETNQPTFGNGKKLNKEGK